MTSYQYTTLAPGQIRLMELEPGQGAKPLICRMIPCLLVESTVKYVALSYCWGEPIFSEHLHAPEALLPITVSLRDALRRIRHPQTTLRVWADGACINQMDVAERNHQISMMGQIYRRASWVFIYLGEAAEESHLVPLLFQDVDREPLPITCCYLADEEGVREAFQSPQPFVSAAQVTAAWRAFMRRPWFMRLWVIQEVALANSAIAVCGRWAVVLETLVELAAENLDREYEDDSSTRLKTFSGRRQLMVMGRLKWDVRSGQPPEFLWLISRTRRSLAANPADYLWGVLGVGDWGLYSSVLSPDYRLPLEEVLRRFAKFFVQEGRGMEMLYYAHIDSWRPEVPSWIPGWATHDDSEYSLFWDTSRPPYPHDVRTGEAEFSLSPDGNIVSIRGRQIGTIDELGASNRELLNAINNNPQGSFPNPLCQWIRTIENMLLSWDYSYNSSVKLDLEQMKWSTLVLGRSIYNDFMRNTHSMSNDALNHLFAAHPVRKNDAFEPQIDTKYRWFVSTYIREAIRTGQSLRLARGSSRSESQITAGVEELPSLWMCQVPYGSKVGDALVLLLGSKVPFVFRRANSEGQPPHDLSRYRVVGPCFIHGMMGEEGIPEPDMTSILTNPFIETFNLI